MWITQDGINGQKSNSDVLSCRSLRPTGGTIGNGVPNERNERIEVG